jgi:hypothetical protein
MEGAVTFRRLGPLAIATFSLLLALGAGKDRRAEPKVVTPTTLDCGPVAVYALFQIEGRPTPIETIAAKLPPPRPDGFSMKELRDASSSLGLTLDGVYLGQDVAAIDRPMLVFLKVDRQGHFLVIRPVGHTGTLVQVIDSGQPPRVMDKAELVSSDQWTGVALVPRRTNWTLMTTLGLLATACAAGLGLTLLRSLRRR